MTIQKLMEAHNRQPFHPFTIHIADGTSVRVRDPEFLMRTGGGRTIHVATGRGEEAQIIDLLLVTKLSFNDRVSRGNGRSH
jgi:hypothetical protein